MCEMCEAVHIQVKGSQTWAEWVHVSSIGSLIHVCKDWPAKPRHPTSIGSPLAFQP